MRTLALAAVVLATAACAPQRPAAQAPTTQATAPTRPAFRGGNAITQSDTPYDQLLAQARSAGRPAVLFFWTSW